MTPPVLASSSAFRQRLVLLFGLWLTAWAARAQVSSYQFVARSGTFTPLVGGTAVPVLSADDAVSAPLPVGFAFQFGGLTYTTAVASSNGYLSFGANPHPTSFANSLSGALFPDDKPLLAPLWNDLSGAGGGIATYATTGAAPDRVFTMQWLNWRSSLLDAAPTVSFQVKLYETTNVVQFIYRPELIPPTVLFASIGLAGPVVVPAPSSFLSLSNSSAAPAASATVENTSIAALPATGQAYTFSPSTIALSTRAQTETAALVVYPNPNNTGHLSMRLATLAPGSATLLNALGQAVRTQPLTAGLAEQVLPTHGLATGIYTLRVQQGHDVFTRKVVFE